MEAGCRELAVRQLNNLLHNAGDRSSYVLSATVDQLGNGVASCWQRGARTCLVSPLRVHDSNHLYLVIWNWEVYARCYSTHCSNGVVNILSLSLYSLQCNETCGDLDPDES